MGVFYGMVRNCFAMDFDSTNGLVFFPAGSGYSSAKRPLKSPDECCTTGDNRNETVAAKKTHLRSLGILQ